MAEEVLVTGGAGFIGSHLAEKLPDSYHVVIMDDLSTGKMENITHLREKPNVQLKEGSITDLALLQELFQGMRYVFHQAALARVPFSIENPLAANEVNITGTLNVLVAARDNKVKRVISAASSSAYGDSTSFPQREDMPPSPLSPYAAGKLAGEYYCNIFNQIYGLSTVCLRYFNVYGPCQDPDSQYATAIVAFVGRVQKDLPPIIYGDGEQSRDFTYIEDIVKANLLAAESNRTGVFNIGNGATTTINRLAELIITLSGKKLNVLPASSPGRPTVHIG